MKKNSLILSIILLIGVLLPLFFAQSQQSVLQISNVSITSKGCATEISWITNIPSRGYLDLGLDTKYSIHRSNAEITTSHKYEVRDLLPEKTYHFRIRVETSLESIATFDRTIKIAKCTETSSAIISNVGVAYITGTSATIQWYTDIPASSFVRYGTTSAYGKTASSGALVTQHDMTIRNLAIGTTYHFKVESKPKNGVVSVYYDMTFRTLANKDSESEALSISNVAPITPQDRGIETDSVRVSWNTNKLGTTVVRYGIYPKTNLTMTVPGFRTFFHEARLPNLKPDTLYAFIVETKDVFGRTVKSDNFSVRTKASATGETPQPPATPPMQPTVAATLSRPSALYRMRGDTRIYAIFNEQKYYIPGLTSLDNYRRMGLRVQDVEPSVLQTIPDVTLIKSDTRSSVYHVYYREAGKRLKLAIPSESVFRSYGQNRWDRIIIITADDVERIPNAQFISRGGSAPVYFLEQNKKHFVGEKKRLSKFGAVVSDLVTVNQTHLMVYPEGNVLN